MGRREAPQRLVKILFGEGVDEIFDDLPLPVKTQAARKISLLASFPFMYPVRRRGIMKGYRYFVSFGYLVYYSVSSREIRISAIIPARMSPA